MTRRRLLQYGALAGGALLVPSYLRGNGRALAAIPGGTLDPSAVPKYRSALFMPPAMPKAAATTGVDYEIALRQFQQQILPAGLPKTTVFGYGPVNGKVPFTTPAATIEATVDTPLRIKWVNGLVDASNRYLRHPLPVDQTLHWANPPGGTMGRDMKGTDPTPYTGPVPIVTHLHGAHVRSESDGFPEAWYLPAASNIPRGYATVGSQNGTLGGISRGAGFVVDRYTNDQPATALWYHDHTLGMTRANVYAGAAGMYVLRGGAFDLPNGLFPEVPLILQDRSFNTNGSLFYPSSRVFFDGFTGPYRPESDIPPIWNPEFFGNMMLVNGQTWPTLTVTPSITRFRVLNACGSRWMILKIASAPTGRQGKPAALPFVRIGGDGGFLRAPTVQGNGMLLGPAERADVLVDFRGLKAGTKLYLINEGPDEPFGGGTGGVDFAFADPASTGQVMEIVVGSAVAKTAGAPGDPTALSLPAAPAPGAAASTRVVSLNELDSGVIDPNTGESIGGPESGRLGTVDSTGAGVPMLWDDPVTEKVNLGTKTSVTEIWEIRNFTEDAHPIHLHQTQFQVLSRQLGPTGAPSAPDPAENGPKDTVIVYPGDFEAGIPGVTKIKATFDIKGSYVWHCHILEHEDNEMMRPLQIV